MLMPPTALLALPGERCEGLAPRPASSSAEGLRAPRGEPSREDLLHFPPGAWLQDRALRRRLASGEVVPGAVLGPEDQEFRC
ncbi:MAG TPA: hypothetical protein VF395_17470, partial [Polyangiaceae bacterium]